MTSKSILRAAREFHQHHVVARLGEPRGASVSEVEALELALGFAIPVAYREYLLWMGHDVDGVFRGTECFIEHVLTNTAALPELLRENGVAVLETGRLVCWFMHQGYIASWFVAHPGVQDPPVLWFSEVERERGVQRGELFSQTLERELREMATAFGTRHRDPAR